VKKLKINELRLFGADSNLSRNNHHKNKTLLPYLNAKKNGTYFNYLTIPILYGIELDFSIKSAISHSENMLNTKLVNFNILLLTDYKGNMFFDVSRNNFGLIIVFFEKCL
jgi:hypothetical protein